MLKPFIAFALVLSLTTLTATSEWVPPQQRDRERSAGQQAASGTVKIPTKWFNGAKGYEKALEAQKQTQADIFIYFVRPNTPNEKGLCTWYENKGIKSQPVRRLLRGYVKVRVPLPANPRNQDLAKKFKVRKTPAVFVIHPDGWRNRCKTFNWDEKPLKLFEPDDLAENIRLNSSDKYQPAKEALSEESGD